MKINIEGIYRKLVILIIVGFFIGASSIPIVSSENNNVKADINTTIYSNNDCDCTIYVDDDNIAGPWDGTTENPYKSIQDAIDNAIIGSSICISNGVYSEIIVIDGHDKDGLSLCGEDKNLTIIDPNNIDNTDTIFLNNVDDVTITGVTITGSGLDFTDNGYSRSGIFCKKCIDIYIYENLIYENGNGINGDSFSDITIEYNNISNNYCDGIRGHSKFQINYNEIYHNGYGEGPAEPNGDGVSIWSNADKSTIFQNVITYNKVDGVWDEGVDGHTISYNTISHNGQAGVHLDEGRICEITDNIINNNGFGTDFRGIATAGILLHQSTVNTMSYNTVFNNKNGLFIRQSQSNYITDNTIIENDRNGVYLLQTSSTNINRNVIIDNKIGISLLVASGFKINNNDIYTNQIFGLVAIIGIGTATENYWGNVWGPYMGNIVRIIPPFPIVFPWALDPNIPDFDDENNDLTIKTFISKDNMKTNYIWNILNNILFENRRV